MGLYITGSLTDGGGDSHSNFYSNILSYYVDKREGTLNARIGSYTDKSASIANSPIYTEDIYDNDASGYFPVPVSTGSYEWGSDFTRWHLTQSVVVTETTYSHSWQDQLVDYIDFDEDGNEITLQRSESIQVMHSQSSEVSKSLIDIDQITGSLYTFTYNKVREYFEDIYGANNVQDDN